MSREEICGSKKHQRALEFCEKRNLSVLCAPSADNTFYFKCYVRVRTPNGVLDTARAAVIW